MLAGSAESCIHPLALAGFSRSGSLTTSSNDEPGRASRPFDVSRDGFVIGEGAGVVLLESYEHAKARGVLSPFTSDVVGKEGQVKIYAEIAGTGSTSDAHHITSPPTSGEGAFRAMLAAVNDAKISPHEIDYINAHATSTKLGDAAEVNAIKSLLSTSSTSNSESERPRAEKNPKSVAVSSFKGSVGHLLGASGSVEAIWTVLAMRNGIIPPTMNLQKEDPDMSVPGLEFLKGKAEKRDVRYALKNSFGFGGTNASLLLKRFEP